MEVFTGDLTPYQKLLDLEKIDFDLSILRGTSEEAIIRTFTFLIKVHNNG